jgi:hypothetical protein
LGFWSGGDGNHCTEIDWRFGLWLWQRFWFWGGGMIKGCFELNSDFVSICQNNGGGFCMNDIKCHFISAERFEWNKEGITAAKNGYTAEGEFEFCLDISAIKGGVMWPQSNTCGGWKGFFRDPGYGRIFSCARYTKSVKDPGGQIELGDIRMMMF